MQRHLPVNLLRASPTAIGRMTREDPSSFLIKAVSEPLARNLATPVGAAKMFTMALREEQMAIGRCTSAASIRCCICSPEGPQALFLGNL